MATFILEKFSFIYLAGKEPAIKNIDLEIRPGELVLLAGRSGSGKSTLLSAIAGLIPGFYRGEVRGRAFLIDGKKINWLEETIAFRGKYTGFVLQDPRHQFLFSRVEEELRFIATQYGFSKTEAEKKITELLNWFEINHLYGKKLEELSAGEKQKIAIASSIIHQPKILVLDEPSSNLSSKGTKILAEVLKRLKERGFSIVLADHRFSWVKNLADRVVVLDRGQVVYNGSPSILDNESFCQTYGLRIEKKVSFPVRKELPKINTELLHVQELSFAYRKKEPPFLKNLSLCVHEGECVFLVGENGTGKTTLLLLIHGLLKPREGRIIFGKPIKKALALQHPDLQLFAPTVEKEVGENASYWLEKFGLLELKDRHPLTLSGGEMQRLLLAATMARAQGGMVLLDEPTSGMDGEQLERLSKLVTEYLGNTTFLIATHDEDLMSYLPGKIFNLLLQKSRKNNNIKEG